MNIIFNNPIGEDFKLQRYPIVRNDKLQAFDASDELVLDQINQKSIDLLSCKDKNILIVGDSFGALTLALDEHSPTSYVDSYVSFKGIKENSDSEPKLISNLNDIPDQLDYVFMKLPKNMSYFEDILIHLSKKLKDRGLILCTGMIKHMSPSAFTLFEKYIGVTTTSLAKKKARVIFCTKEKPAYTEKSPYPNKLKIPMWEKELTNHSNLFSRDKLDIGTRFFLEHIPQGDFRNILDLGCANGIIGLKAKENNPNSRIIFSDESYMAILSAQENYKNSFEDDCQIHWQNCYESADLNKVDLVLCNPPFHQNNTVGDFIALQMFKDSFNALNTGGMIRVIGNRHLGYHVRLKKLFNNSEVVASNKKFVIIDAYKK